MDGNVLGVLGIPLELVFEEGLDAEKQASVIRRVEEKTCFRLKREMDIDILISEVANDETSTMETLKSYLGKGLFGGKFGFLDAVSVIVCSEKISVDEMSKHYVPIDEIMGEEVEEVFRRIADLEGRKRIERQANRWSLKSLKDIFKSNPDEDKRFADGLFVLERYKEAYRIYSRYNGVDEFSCYCIEMSIYCLILSKKSVPSSIVNSLGMFGSEKVCLVRITSIAIGFSDILALEMLALLQEKSLFKALAQESLAQVLDGKKYHRKKIEMWFNSSLEFREMKYIGRSIRCCECYLDLSNFNFINGILPELERNILLSPNRYIKETLELMKGNCSPGLEDGVIEKSKEEIVIWREYQGSMCNFQGVANVVESIFVQFKGRGLVSILQKGEETPKTYWTNQKVTFDGPGEFIIEDITFNAWEVEYKVKLGIPIDIREDTPFMHVEMKDVHEVLCGELYFLSCKIVRNHNSRVKILFDNREFTTSSNMFGFEMVFQAVGVYSCRIILEAEGVITYKDVMFTVIPSFSIDTFNYKYCLPLVFLKIESHIEENSRVRSCLALSKDLEVSGLDTTTGSFYSYKEYAIEYFRKNIVGVGSGDLGQTLGVEKEKPILPENLQKLLHGMDKSPPVTSDLLFSDLIPVMEKKMIIPGEGTYSFCTFLQGKKPLRELLSPRAKEPDKVSKRETNEVILYSLKNESLGTIFDGSLEEQPGKISMRIEIEIPPKRVCVFVVKGIFEALFSPEGLSDEGIIKPICPFVYITHFSPARLKEPTIIYLCVSNYYEQHVLDVEISSPTIAICSSDSKFRVEKLSFSLFEVRSAFKKRKKYEESDIKISIKVENEEIDHECLVELPLVS
ncbi:uncharacterized protein Eint_031240 [Encephalitozoon intestinalis ATCC 50506]|uniref:Uncharacterized protein n=1 Tax=Encephalitozoon intestinalis (strain ATCC 50506) TaxID=876142 RepID=E0S6D1_ENCIT|nr:uncharacterized protein Eint_031240 [Encephalitozoon intestinalis ATCC 50506]ADM11266.1 hypothetical protein Eint_031240 [Encephalitozoon intestinalis ATCC 50506]UTX44934.1 hypothetical protein GPK93_03g04630 [Encephalitozoon intestinalis]